MANRGIEQKAAHTKLRTTTEEFAYNKTDSASYFPPMPKRPPFGSSALNVCSARVSLLIARRANHCQLNAIKLIQIAGTACMATSPQMELEVPFVAMRSHPGHRVLEGSTVTRMMTVQSTGTAQAAAATLATLRQNRASKFMNGSSLSLEGISALPMKPSELHPRLK